MATAKAVKMYSCDMCAGEEPDFTEGERTTRLTRYNGAVSGEKSEDIGPVCAEKTKEFMRQEGIELKPLNKHIKRIGEPGAAGEPTPGEPAPEPVPANPADVD